MTDYDAPGGSDIADIDETAETDVDSTFVHDLVVRFPYPDEERARTVADALAPEVDAIDDDRSRADLERDGSTVTLRVRARDLVALRAGFNSWTRLVDVAETVAIAGRRGAGGDGSA